MAWSEKLKLNKQLIRSVTEAGLTTAKEIQQKTLSRIMGGQDVISIGPEGCGKTTTYILAVLNTLKHNPEGVPHTLILVPDKDRVLEVIERFDTFNKNKQVRFVGLYPANGTEAQMDELADGADIVVATPDRARAIYLKLGLNLNKVTQLIIDDAQQIVKQGLQLPVVELANSIGKCQRLVFTEVMHDKLDKMLAPFMSGPAIVEVEEIGEDVTDTHQQVLYHLPNFGTKLNLLNLFMQDDELFTKAVVFVNTAQTATKIYKSLENRLKNLAELYNPAKNIADFKNSNKRVLVIANENCDTVDLDGLPFIIHFELPLIKETFIERVTNNNGDEETLALTFVTDLELPMVKKIEQTIGQKIPIADLPDDLVIEKERKTVETEEKITPKKKNTEPVAGEAFHQKKPENAKTYNISAGKKAKMNNKKKH